MTFWLTIVRHAKAEPSSPDGTDRGRRFAERGLAQAADLASRLPELFEDQKAPEPHLVMFSSAERAAQTARALIDAFPAAQTWAEPGLYSAGVDDVVDALRAVEGSVQNVVVVGHNPTMHELALYLGPEHADDFLPELPTATAVLLGLRISRWSEVGRGCGAFLATVRGRG